MLGHRQMGESEAVSKENEDEASGWEEGLRFRPDTGAGRDKQGAHVRTPAALQCLLTPGEHWARRAGPSGKSYHHISLLSIK